VVCSTYWHFWTSFSREIGPALYRGSMHFLSAVVELLTAFYFDLCHTQNIFSIFSEIFLWKLKISTYWPSIIHRNTVNLEWFRPEIGQKCKKVVCKRSRLVRNRLYQFRSYVSTVRTAPEYLLVFEALSGLIGPSNAHAIAQSGCFRAEISPIWSENGKN